MCTPGNCGGVAEHERVKRSTREWNELPPIGQQSYTDEDGARVTLDMRNVGCGSTIARRVTP